MPSNIRSSWRYARPHQLCFQQPLERGISFRARGLPDYARDVPTRGANPLPQSSRSRIRGLTESARCAGIHVASSPSKAIATTTPASTNGSRGVAW